MPELANSSPLLLTGLAACPELGSPAALAWVSTSGKWRTARHLSILNRLLLSVARGETTRLLVTVPPRHGKSTLSSHYFPAWYLGMYPDRRVLLAGYEADFASSWGRKARNVLERYGRSFGVEVDHRSSAADRWDISGRAGGMATAGIGGPLTGKGADLLLIDDPVKNAEEAGSETYREKAWEWYASTAFTRLEPNGSIIVIQTRWHEDDLAGRILKNSKERWEVIRLSALAEEGDYLGRQPGEALWPERYDRESLLNIKQEIGSYWFSALYQQDPEPVGEGRFDKAWLGKRFIREGDYWIFDGRRYGTRDLSFFQTVDHALTLATSSDWTVIGTFAVTPKHELLWVDCERFQAEAPGVLLRIRQAAKKWNPLYVVIEGGGTQKGLVQFAREKKEGWPTLSIREHIPGRKDKLQTAMPSIVLAEQGRLYFAKEASWLDVVLDELLRFTGDEKKDKHDDIVSALSFAAIQSSHFELKAQGFAPHVIGGM